MVDCLEEGGQGCEVLFVDVVEFFQEFFFFGGDGGPDDVEFSGDGVPFSGVAIIGFFDEPQEPFFELIHVGLRIIDLSNDLHILSLDLRDGLLDQLNLMILMRP